MEVYLSKAGLARSLGIHPNNLLPPPPDVIIGKWRGWLDVRDAGGHDSPLRLLSAKEVADHLSLTRKRVRELRRQNMFPPAVACIELCDPARELPTRGWDGRVYGWHEADIVTFRAITGRENDAQKGKQARPRGRPPGSGDYTGLPRCLRPRTDSVHGDGRACQAIRCKINGRWAPACGTHLTAEERHTLHIACTPQAEGPPA